jgi:hypothetical protein
MTDPDLNRSMHDDTIWFNLQQHSEQLYTVTYCYESGHTIAIAIAIAIATYPKSSIQYHDQSGIGNTESPSYLWIYDRCTSHGIRLWNDDG